jgi:tripartite-type tricarboxylate transporter receptor subunit TctC
MKTFLSLVLAVVALGVAPAADAQPYPNRPVRLVVSFPAGTTPDIVARVVAPKLQQALGQPVIVDNRAGAGGNLAADQVAKSAPDGYTLLVTTNAAAATNKVLFTNLPYDPETDLATISLLATAPQVLVVHPSVPATTFREFIDHARRNPGKLSYGSTGSGSASHLTMELLKSDTGVDTVHVPYKGFPQAVGDMLGGNLQTMIAIIPGMLPHISSGKIRALAVTSLQRSRSLPEVPSVAEVGLPQLESLAWIGLLAPAKVPQEIVDRLASEVQRILREPDSREALAKQGFDVVGNTPAEFRRFQASEIAKWGRVIRAVGATPD